jgi:transposase
MSKDDLFPAMTTDGTAPQAEPVTAAPLPAPSATSAEARPDPRLRRPDRAQLVLEPVCLDDRIEPDHPVRIVWALVEKANLGGFLAKVQARGSTPGRPATDPRLLVALWLYAYIEGIGCGRELDERCQRDDPYRWLCGGVSMNYHTLNDFRVEHEKELDDLLSQMIGVLTGKGLVDVSRISQDGMRTRANAGSNSFKTRKTLEDHLQQARAHVEAVKNQPPAEGLSAQQRAAQERAAREKEELLKQALEELAQIEQAKSKQKEKPSKHHEAKASETDPEARPMKMSDGGVRPAFNIQFATSVVGRAIVGVQVSKSGSDAGLDEPMRREVTRRTGQPLTEQLLDGGYVKLDAIDAADKEGVTLYMPVPKPKKTGVDRYAPKRDDSEPAVGWRQRMGGPGAPLIYGQRASTSETVNAETKTCRGLGRILVRGLKKVRCVALWSALAYNLVHFGAAMIG